MASQHTASVPGNDDGVVRTISRPYFYREAFVPAATVQCHASNLLLLPEGDLLCAWFGGSLEGKPDISIYISRLKAGETTWSSPARVTHDETRSEQNPVLFTSPNANGGGGGGGGELRLFYTSQHAGNQDSAIVKQQISTDNGFTWSEPPQTLFADPGTFIRQPCIVLDNGTWVMPTFKCRAAPGERWVGNDDISCVRASNDRGKTWTETEVPDSAGCVHMEIQRLKKDGTFLALFRSRWADFIYSSTSADGLAWSSPQPLSLPNPNAGICFDVLDSGRLVLVYNHSCRANATGRREGLYDEIGIEAEDDRQNQAAKHPGKEAFWGAPRAPLCVAWSDDTGRTWKRRVLEDGDGHCISNNSEERLNRELSYPSMVVGKDGTIHIAFTFWRQAIKYVRIKEDFFDV